ncbi:hypothetical protein QVD17_28070 [Tagetes erecta]|uniref:Uncharacterized protein n=1 Tax=Tagetes erecta TaxID=13708 RepID=A0AAD8KAD1_TARER|nr:hypothetical protein QVD17_28070 [Tagetes erecta]
MGSGKRRTGSKWVHAVYVFMVASGDGVCAESHNIGNGYGGVALILSCGGGINVEKPSMSQNLRIVVKAQPHHECERTPWKSLKKNEESRITRFTNDKSIDQEFMTIDKEIIYRLDQMRMFVSRCNLCVTSNNVGLQWRCYIETDEWGQRTDAIDDYGHDES